MPALGVQWKNNNDRGITGGSVGLGKVECTWVKCFMKRRVCMDKVFYGRQVWENYVPNGKGVIKVLWIWEMVIIVCL